MPINTSESPSEGRSNVRLNSWKELAVYLQCGVRTVQRWEKTEGLPIHRHLHQTQGTIYAFTAEIDEWRRNRARPTDAAEEPGQHASVNLRPIVGRVSELSRLQSYWSTALAGTRQVVFVSGTIGVGKTALVRTFLEHLDPSWIIQGDAVEPFGTVEPYLPVLEGIARLVRSSRNQRPVGILAKYAPSWVIHIPDFPGLHSIAAESKPDRPDRMVREIIDAVESLSHDKPVVLFLEDLHWADRSTIEFVERLARRPDRARILVIGTHRFEEWTDQPPPLIRARHDLRAHGLCHQLAVPPFSPEEVVEHLKRRGAWADIYSVAQQFHQWTAGVPLFLNILVDDLVETGRLTQVDGAWRLSVSADQNAPPIAPTIRVLIESSLGRLTSDEQRVLEAASASGQAFFDAVVAAAMRVDLRQVEPMFESLAERYQFIKRESSDETLGSVVTAKYSFLHSLYQHVIYNRLSPSSRADFHREMGQFLESVYCSGRSDLAPELAMHFERSRDFQRAALYFEAAAAMALERGASHEALISAQRALDQLANLPECQERLHHELNLRLKICAALSNLSTMADPQVQHAYGEALKLCERLDDHTQTIPALLGIGRFHTVRGHVETGRQIGERALGISRGTGDPVFRAQALQHLSVTCCLSGRFAEAHAYAREAVETSSGIFSDALLTSGFHPGPAALTIQGWVSWIMGYPDQAQNSALGAVALATKLSHPQTLAYTYVYAAMTLEMCGSRDQSLSWAETALTLGKQNELVFAMIFAEGVLGWILGRRGSQEGADSLARSIELQSSVGVNLWIPQMDAWLAENLLRTGNLTDAAMAVDQGLKVARQFGITANDAELLGLRAEVLAAFARDPIVAASLGVHAGRPEELARQSYSIAVAQEAKSLQLRAVVRLLRLATTSTRADEAYNLLSDTYTSFSEGFDTPDLLEARGLLNSVRAGPTLK